MTESPALKGIKVVAVEQAVAGPYCTRLLADMGAEVIKIEKPGTGDFARHYDRAVKGMSSYFVALNAGKKSLVLDLTKDEGKEILRKLVARADVFVHNLSSESAEKLWGGYKGLSRINPSLVYCGISGYGLSGPYSNEKAYDLLIQGESGLISLTGYPDSPAKVGVSVCDLVTGVFSALAIVSALLRRRSDGEGVELQMSLFNCILDIVAPQAYYSEYSGTELPRTGMKHNMIAPYGVYLTSDGKWIIVAVQHEEEWRSFCEKVLEKPELVVDKEFESNEKRMRHRDHLEKIIEAVFKQHDYAFWRQKLTEAKIAKADVNSVSGLFTHPQVIHDGFRNVLSKAGALKLFRSPLWSLSSKEQMSIPETGQNAVDVLTEIGYSKDSIARLKKDGII